MQRTAVFPGSFDPITIGHVDIVQRALPLFDKIIIAIGNNSEKKSLFSLSKRIALIKKIFRSEPQIEVQSYSGLTVNFCRQVNANFILRGLRTTSDFDYERTIALLNKSMFPELETISLISRAELSHISSTVVREIYLNGGDIGKFVHAEIQEDVKSDE